MRGARREGGSCLYLPDPQKQQHGRPSEGPRAAAAPWGLGRKPTWGPDGIEPSRGSMSRPRHVGGRGGRLERGELRPHTSSWHCVHWVVGGLPSSPRLLGGTHTWGETNHPSPADIFSSFPHLKECFKKVYLGSSSYPSHLRPALLTRTPSPREDHYSPRPS